MSQLSPTGEELSPTLKTAFIALDEGLSAVVIHAIGEPWWTKSETGEWVRRIDRKTGRPAEYGPKVPCGGWRARQQVPHTKDEIRKYLTDQEWGSSRGIALVCGYGDVELLEFDDIGAWERYLAAAEADTALKAILDRVMDGYFELSPRGAPHLLYRCTDLGNGGPLGRRPEIMSGTDGRRGFKVLIETRGPGQIAVIAPSPGTCHMSGRPYVLKSGGLQTLVRLTPAERQRLHDLARSFDEVGEEESRYGPGSRVQSAPAAAPSESEKPGDHFNRVATVDDWMGMLAEWKWEYIGAVGNRSHCWVHSTANNFLSAHLTPANTLLVYSTNAPLAAWTPQDRATHSAFHVFAAIHHRGDHSAAARALRAKGYGSSPAGLAPTVKYEPRVDDAVRQSGEGCADVPAGSGEEIDGTAPPRRTSDGPPDPGPLGGTMPGPGLNVRPQSRITIGPDEHRVVDECIQALTSDPELYQRGGEFVRVGEDGDTGTPVIVRVGAADLRRRLTEVAALYEVVRDRNGNGESLELAHPPQWLIPQVADHPEKPDIRRLAGVSTVPILRADGSIRSDAGYDPETRMVFSPGGVTFPPVPVVINQEHVAEAVAALLDLIADFPIPDPAGRAVFLSLILSPLGRHLIEGGVPLHLIDANVRGSGKGLLIDVAGTIILGGCIPTQCYSPDLGELRKVITSVVIAGKLVQHLDNLPSGGAFGNAALDSALTSTVWEDRVLGENRKIALPHRTVWCASGNNVVLRADTARRVIRARLESANANPEDRHDFRYPDLLQHVRDNRPDLVSHALTVLAGYLRAGRPDMKLSAAGSFVGWSSVVRAAIVWTGQPDPWATNVSARGEIDTEAGELDALVAAWEELTPGGEAITVAEAKKRFDQSGGDKHPQTAELLTVAGLGEFDAGKVGYLLRKHKGRPLPSLKTIVNTGAGSGVKKWRVAAPIHVRSGDGGDRPVFDQSPSRGNRVGAGRDSGDGGDDTSAPSFHAPAPAQGPERGYAHHPYHPHTGEGCPLYGSDELDALRK